MKKIEARYADSAGNEFRSAGEAWVSDARAAVKAAGLDGGSPATVILSAMAIIESLPKRPRGRSSADILSVLRDQARLEKAEREPAPKTPAAKKERTKRGGSKRGTASAK